MKTFHIREIHEASGSPGWIVGEAVDGGEFVPVQPAKTFLTPEEARLEAERLDQVETEFDEPS